VTAPAAPSRQRSTGFAHRPGLDGLRGLAVAGVLAFHAGFGWAAGGYLGVSAFFTLSGFLITTLLLGEQQGTGRIGLRAFWIRRFRRLLPAALLGVLAATAYVLAFADQNGLDRFRGDALAAIGYVANWRFVLSDLSYAELFTGDSPLQHYWSLAIEEQFYLVLPLVAVVLLRGRAGWKGLAVLAFAGIVASVVATLVVGGGDRAYYGTDTRMAELLVGVLLAVWHHRRDLDTSLPDGVRAGVGAAALAAMLGLWVVTEQSSGALHPWVLLGHAVLTGAIIVSVLTPTPVARVLSLRPLTGLGRISYGVYVYHWPIFLWLSPERTGLDGGGVDDVLLAGLRILATLAIAVPSHRFVEQPIRHGGLRLGERRGPLLAIGSVTAVILVAVVPPTVVDRPPVIDFEAAQDLERELLEEAKRPTTTTSTAPTTTAPGAPSTTAPPDPGPPPRVAVFGDSTALLFLPGLIGWGEITGGIDLAGGFTQQGCGLGRGGERDWLDQGAEPVPEGCSFDTAWTGPLSTAQPDIAVVEIGVWDLLARRIPGDDQWRRIGDPVYDQYMRGEIRAATDLLLGTADKVVWVLQPPPVASTRDDDDPIFDELPLWNQMILDVLEGDPRVGFVDLEDWMASLPEGTESLRLRPDGTHFTRLTSVELATWLAPAILEAARTTDVVGADDVERVPVA
jgi:peptidoglycan/LPS O-acetylase OafA/YrhL